MNSRVVRSLGLVALPLVTGGWLATASAAATDGPRYSYLDVGYQWTDVNYAVKQAGGRHEGLKVNGSLGLANLGPVGIHLFGEFFDGDFSGTSTPCAGGVGGPTSVSGNRNSQSVAGGLGLSYAINDSTDVVARAAYVDITDFEVPNSSCQLDSGSDQGYLTEAMIRSELSDNVEIEAGVRYSNLSDSDIANTDVLLGIGYHLTDWVSLRARAVIFDNDTGIELGARLYFGSFVGRDTIF